MWACLLRRTIHAMVFKAENLPDLQNEIVKIDKYFY